MISLCVLFYKKKYIGEMAVDYNYRIYTTPEIVLSYLVQFKKKNLPEFNNKEYMMICINYLQKDVEEEESESLDNSLKFVVWECINKNNKPYMKIYFPFDIDYDQDKFLDTMYNIYIPSDHENRKDSKMKVMMKDNILRKHITILQKVRTHQEEVKLWEDAM